MSTTEDNANERKAWNENLLQTNYQEDILDKCALLYLFTVQSFHSKLYKELGGSQQG